MRGGGLKDSLSDERNKHLSVVANYAIVKVPTCEERPAARATVYASVLLL